MSLQALSSSATGAVGERISSAVESLDDVIRQIRNTIFQLPSRNDSATGLRDEMLRLADRFQHELGALPRIAFLDPSTMPCPRSWANISFKCSERAFPTSGDTRTPRKLKRSSPSKANGCRFRLSTTVLASAMDHPREMDYATCQPERRTSEVPSLSAGGNLRAPSSSGEFPLYSVRRLNS